MVAPAPVNPPGPTQTAALGNELTEGVSPAAMTLTGFVRSFGFQLLVFLLGIALAFM